MSQSSPLGALRRLYRPTPEHKSRAHTLRGTTMTGREWLDVPVQLGRRLRRDQRDEPWMSLSAVRALDALIQPSWSLVEIGGGASTLWFAARAGSVGTYESDAAWSDAIRAKVADAGVTNVQVHAVEPGTLPAAVAGLADDSLDLLLVDAGDDTRAEGGRMASVRAGRTKVKPGGYLVLDNSDRPDYAEADELLAGWAASRYTGPPARPLTVTETTVFRRPG